MYLSLRKYVFDVDAHEVTVGSGEVLKVACLLTLTLLTHFTYLLIYSLTLLTVPVRRGEVLKVAYLLTHLLTHFTYLLIYSLTLLTVPVRRGEVLL